MPNFGGDPSDVPARIAGGLRGGVAPPVRTLALAVVVGAVAFAGIAAAVYIVSQRRSRRRQEVARRSRVNRVAAPGQLAWTRPEPEGVSMDAPAVEPVPVEPVPVEPAPVGAAPVVAAPVGRAGATAPIVASPAVDASDPAMPQRRPALDTVLGWAVVIVIALVLATVTMAALLISSGRFVLP